MTDETMGQRRRRAKLHPAALRAMHWLNAMAIIIMIGSGWKIYNDQPIFASIRFPELFSIGGDPETSFKLNGDGGFGGALQWHFAAMWVLVLSGLGYVAYGLVTGRFRRKLLPIRPRQILVEIGKALRFRLAHDDITHYNAVQKVLYVGIILVVMVQVAAGLALWKSVQFSDLVAFFGGFQGVRVVHFVGMGLICAFLVVHVLLALIVPRTLLAMVTGGPRIATPGQDSTTVPLAQPQAGAL